MNQNETASVINHTEHSLFLTTIIMNKGLWNELTLEQQQIFQESAIAAAHIERAESLEDIEITQKRAVQDGIQVNYLAPETQQQFKKSVDVVYDKYQDYFSNNLVSRIQNS
jgi:TRAP-type C4-dicarboxylate transport system substrate-binding protein